MSRIKTKKCPNCKGIGIPVIHAAAKLGLPYDLAKCRKCGGTGRIILNE